MNRLLISFISLLILCTTVHSQLTYPKIRVDFDSVIEFGNLELYPVHFVYGGDPYPINESNRQMLRNITNLKKGLSRRNVSVREMGDFMAKDIN
ncbi:MAG: hypothetical protein ACM3H8_02235, partial [Sphingobacteriales bacterium]